MTIFASSPWYNDKRLSREGGGRLIVDVIQALVLGVVQGLGEFLPISSSAHLVLVPWLLGWPYAGLAFDVALHMGTLLAVVAFFWRDWLMMLDSGLRGRRDTEGRLFWYLVLATIPGAAFGYMMEDYAETIFRHPLQIGILLMIMGVILYLVDSRCRNIKNLNQVSLSDSLLIGVSQALAILPGVSRSGITMTAGRLMGLTRETAARFSFLLATPIIFGAGVKELSTMTRGDFDTAFFVGVSASAVVGFLSIKFLLRYLTRNSFAVFVWYRLVVGGAVVIIYFARGA